MAATKMRSPTLPSRLADLVSDLAGLIAARRSVIGQLARIPAIINVTGRLSAEGGAAVQP